MKETPGHHLYTIVQLKGALDNETVPHLMIWMKSKPWPHLGTIVLDMKEVNDFSTAGLASLIMLHKMTSAEIALINLSDRTKAMFDIMRIDERLFKWINVRSTFELPFALDENNSQVIEYPA